MKQGNWRANLIGIWNSSLTALISIHGVSRIQDICNSNRDGLYCLVLLEWMEITVRI